MAPLDPNEVPPSALRTNRDGLWAITAIITAAGIGAGVYVAYTLAHQAALPLPAVVEAPPPPMPEDAGPEVDLADADSMLLEGGKTLGDSAEAAAWLAEPGMLRRLVAAVWQVSAGESPREPLRFLAPKAEYSVISHDGHTYQSPESEARYDAVAKAIGAVNAQAAGALYRRAQAFAEAAFKEITPSGSRFTAALDKAIERLTAVPLRDEPLEVKPVDKGVGYTFADPQLEALDPVQKHLLRMGPVNARIVVQQLKVMRLAAAQ